MARKRSVFFRAIQSLLKLVRLRVCGGVFGDRLYLRGLTLLLLGIVLTTGLPPVLSQMPGVNSIARSPNNFLQALQKVQALQESGRYYEACGRLVEALRLDLSICKDKDLTKENNDFQLIINSIQKQQYSTQIIGILGSVLRGIGRLEESQKFLEQGLKMAKAKSPHAEGDMLLSLGNTLRAMGNRERDQQVSPVYDYIPWRCVNPSKVEKIPENASKFYQKASEKYQEAIDTLPSSSATRIKVQLNSLNLALEMGDKSAAKAIANEKINLSSLPNNRTKVYARINLAKSLTCLQQTIPGNKILWEDIINQLNEAVRDAQELKDERAKSYALGNFAGLYEYLGWLNEQPQQQKTTKNWREEALKLTQEALYLAQPSQAPDIAYRWQWQLGRLFEAQGNNQEAIAAYTGAVNTLQALRKDLVVFNQDIQFSFREQVEPVYRKLVDLLLQPNGEAETSQPNLKQAREVIEKLQLAELDNFFREACLDVKPKQIDEIDKTAAVIYTIILGKRLEIILSLPGQDLIHDTAQLPEKFEGTLEALRKSLIEKNDLSPTEHLKDSQQVYRWLFPSQIESNLKAAKLVEKDDIPTLVFVLDSPLRNIPMAALYDGQEYLVEKYATAVAPGLQLLDPKPLELEPLILMAGLTEKAPSFRTPPTWRVLKHVGDELSEIGTVISRNRLLKDSRFIVGNLENELSTSAFTIVHLATHGQFSSNLDKTYILDWNNPIHINQLNKLLRASETRGPNPIELLVLSACQTAEGDKRAALGLAGVAVRAGARSTLATLWSVNDKSTAEFMSQFYTELVKPEMTRAKALCLVQRAFLKQDKYEPYQHPKHWASFILVGNWI